MNKRWTLVIGAGLLCYCLMNRGVARTMLAEIYTWLREALNLQWKRIGGHAGAALFLAALADRLTASNRIPYRSRAA